MAQSDGKTSEHGDCSPLVELSGSQNNSEGSVGGPHWLNIKRNIKKRVINRKVVFDFLDFDFHLVNRGEFSNAERDLDPVNLPVISIIAFHGVSGELIRRPILPMTTLGYA